MTRPRRSAYDPVKRLLDILLGVALLVATLPLQLVVALVVLVALGRPVLFRQPRVGRDGEVFELRKFRTMVEVGRTADAADAARLTPLGRALRATSLDELPSLAHVVRGQMSIVGPRPLLVHYLPRYSDTQRRRHEVRPGITGFAQVRGRNASDWDRRLADDVWYVDHRSLRLDAAILARTVATVLRREGIWAEGHATSPEFLGSGQAR